MKKFKVIAGTAVAVWLLSSWNSRDPGGPTESLRGGGDMVEGVTSELVGTAGNVLGTAGGAVGDVGDGLERAGNADRVAPLPNGGVVPVPGERGN